MNHKALMCLLIWIVWALIWLLGENLKLHSIRKIYVFNMYRKLSTSSGFWRNKICWTRYKIQLWISRDNGFCIIYLSWLRWRSLAHLIFFSSYTEIVTYSFYILFCCCGYLCKKNWQEGTVVYTSNRLIFN